MDRRGRHIEQIRELTGIQALVRKKLRPLIELADRTEDERE